MNTIPHRINSITQRNRSRFNPLRNIDLDSLSRQLDAFESGYLREAVETWDTIEKRDDLLKAVIPKRKKSISRHGWEVIIPRHTDRASQSEAEAHKLALETFYRNLTCTNAVDANERGAFKLLIRQMMDAIGKRYAVHEIVWNPNHESGLTAEFRFVPLSYFENTTGKLRFLNSDGALEGQSLEPGAWLVTTGDGLMVASSLAWMFKNITMKDWLDFSDHNGTPSIQGITNAARDSADWNAMLETVNDLVGGKSVVTNSTDAVKVIDLAQGSNIPFPGLSDRMDRMMAALWRGADLSTLSREHGYGASLQDRETCLLEEDDCELISETLNDGVDTWVIRYLFGKDVTPLARVRVLPAPRECSEYDLRVDQFLLSYGAPLSLKETVERYGRELPEPGDAILQLNKMAVATPNCSSREACHVPRGDETHSCLSGSAICDLRSAIPPSPAISNQLSAIPPDFAICDLTSAIPALAPTSKTSVACVPSVPSLERLPNTEPSHPFSLLQGDWIQLSPLGDFPHGQGIQRVDAESLTAITGQFNSLFSRLGRLFVGVPFYIGHPDVPSLSREFPDRKAYGWITALEARETGLVAKVKWSSEGRSLIEQAHYKFLSPYWEADQIAVEGGRKIFRPKRLISVGLTNQPNIPVLPLANHCSSQGDDAHLPPSENPNGVPELSPGLFRAPSETTLGNNPQNIPNPEGVAPAASTTPKPQYPHLANSLGALHTQSLTNDLGRRNSQRGRTLARQARIQELVTEKMSLGNTYDQAWTLIKEQHPALFTN